MASTSVVRATSCLFMSIEASKQRARTECNSTRLHPGHTLLQAGVHAGGIEMDRTSVAGQHPLEAVVEQTLHRGNLLAPGVPAGTPEGIEMAARLAPGHVVAGEEEGVAIEEDGVPFRVAGRGDHEQVVVDRDGDETGRLTLDGGGPGADIVAVKNARAAEALVELLVVGHVVLMRQEHRLHAAERGDVLHQRCGKTW